MTSFVPRGLGFSPTAYTLPQEYLGGFWVIEASDLDTGAEWAKEASKACVARVEVGAFQDEPAWLDSVNAGAWTSNRTLVHALVQLSCTP